MKKSLLIIVVATIAFASGLSVRWLLSAPNEQGTPAGQIRLPEFVLPDLSGKQRSINEWQGKVLVINFWATWCPPCLKEMPEFEVFQKEYGSTGLQIVGVAIDDSEPVKAFVDSKKITYPILLGQDTGIQLAHNLGNVINTVPFTVIVDKNGYVVKTHMGELTKEKLKQMLTAYLKP